MTTPPPLDHGSPTTVLLAELWKPPFVVTLSSYERSFISLRPILTHLAVRARCDIRLLAHPNRIKNRLRDENLRDMFAIQHPTSTFDVPDGTLAAEWETASLIEEIADPVRDLIVMFLTGGRISFDSRAATWDTPAPDLPLDLLLAAQAPMKFTTSDDR